jgi:hypothetical protein
VAETFKALNMSFPEQVARTYLFSFERPAHNEATNARTTPEMPPMQRMFVASWLIRSPNAPTLYATRRLLSLAVRRETEESYTEETYDEFLRGLANNPVNPKVLQRAKKA